MPRIVINKSHTIESKISDQFNCSLSKLSAASISASGLSEIGRVGPTANGEQDLQLPILLLEQKQLLNTAIDIGTDVIPGVCGVVLLNVRPGVGQITVARSQCG